MTTETTTQEATTTTTDTAAAPTVAELLELARQQTAEARNYPGLWPVVGAVEQLQQAVEALAQRVA